MLILSLLELKLLDLRRVQGLEGKSLQQLTQQLQENYAESVVVKDGKIIFVGKFK